MTKTALTTSLMLLSAGIASAQTTVSGNLALVYKAISNDATTQKANNFRQFGKESQINIANKGKLNNGMDYAAGFSIELDGNDTMAPNATSTSQASNTLAAAFNENVYIDFIMGNTTLTLGADHIQNPDFTITNLTGAFDQDDVVKAIAGQTGQLYNAAKNSGYEAYGIGVMQTVPGIGRLSFNYTPDKTAGAANGDTTPVNAANVQSLYDAGESSMEIGFRGDAGVKGLALAAFYNKDHSGGAPSDASGKMVAASYNFGQFTVAGERAIVEANTGIETKSNSVGIAFAVSNTTSVGYNLTKTKSNERAGVSSSGSSNTSRDQDEKIHGLSVAHSLGPVSVALAYGKVDSLRGVSNNDGEALVFRTNVNF